MIGSPGGSVCPRARMRYLAPMSTLTTRSVPAARRASRSEPGATHPRAAQAAKFVARTAASLDALADALDGSFDEAVAVLRGARRIVVSGVGKSGLIGGKIAATLSSTGSPAHFLHATEAAHGDLGIVTEEDAVLAISNSGDSHELAPIVAYCRRFSVPLVGITSRPRSSLGRRADVLLVLPPEREAGPIPSAPMTSTTMTLVLGDALASALIDEKGFRPEDFNRFHPGGKLGVQTMRLSKLIEEAEADHGAGNHPLSVVAVSCDAPIGAVVDAISFGGRGIVGVRDEEAGGGDDAGRIVGIITDGDVRRAVPALQRGEVRCARDIMHRDPIHLPDTALVADALATLEENRVNGLFVRGTDGRVRAIVHLQDLLRAGAA